MRITSTFSLCLIIFGLAAFFAVVLPAGPQRLVVVAGVIIYAWVKLDRVPSLVSPLCRAFMLSFGTLIVLSLAVS